MKTTFIVLAILAGLTAAVPIAGVDNAAVSEREAAAADEHSEVDPHSPGVPEQNVDAVFTFFGKYYGKRDAE
ncbi:hypothetical protein MMC10_006751 [Thelotrema lepadinum]|nr:hypothetical protein [Thelotrema lepadinum]